MINDFDLKTAIQRGYLKIKVIPGAPRSEFRDFMIDGSLKVAIKEKALSNQANLALIDFLAKKLEISRENVIIISGKTSRIKLIKIV